jgi:hypothetical protein
MTLFFRLLEDEDKAVALRLVARSPDARVYEVDPKLFGRIPGSPFAYWVSKNILDVFLLPHGERHFGAYSGGKTLDDTRFIRASWEILQPHWRPFAKGGTFSPYYADVYLCLYWKDNGAALKEYLVDYRQRHGWSPNWTAELHSAEHYFRPGLTWPRRTNGLSFRALPSGCIFADKGPAIFVDGDDVDYLLELAGIINSLPFRYLVTLQLARTELAQSYEVGLIQQTPVPDLHAIDQTALLALVHRAWSLKRTLDEVNETSHAFVLPAPLLHCLMTNGFDRTAIQMEIAGIQQAIDDICFRLYGLHGQDRDVIESWSSKAEVSLLTIDANQGSCDDQDSDEDETGDNIVADDAKALLSWAAGVAFGRFDIRLATGERQPPPQPEPFEPLPPRSPGILPDDSAPFHLHPGILVDNPGHSHDLPRLMEDVLATVGHPASEDARRWLQRDFFPHHLKQYSKSRRKASIYWPLSNVSGSYTLWLYYPALTDQTLYTAANDFVGPKLEETSRLATALRTSTSRSRVEERQLEQLADLETELKELQDELLRLAPIWKPNHDDGVQITAAPLWRLFRYRPWQTVLKETWEKLERGDYDWAHLAMTYWPDRVREKCRTDKSLAIAHELEDLYEPPPENPVASRRGRKRAVDAA